MKMPSQVVMNNRPTTPGVRLLWAAVLGICGLVLLMAGRAAYTARARAAVELGRANITATQVRELANVRPAASIWQHRGRPSSGLAASLGDTLAGCGLATSVLTSVTPQPGLPVDAAGAGGLRRQRASFTLAPVTLPDLGAFLDAWRVREPLWTVTTIDLSPEMRAEVARIGGDRTLRAVMTLDAVYLAAEEKESRR